MFNVGALNASHRTDRMSANPIRIFRKGTRSLVRIARIGRIAFPSGASVRWSASNFSSSPIPPFVTFSVLDWKKCVTVKVKLLLAAC